MRILFLTMQLGRGYQQGTERYVSTLGECLLRRGHDVGYLAGDPLGLRPPRKLGTLLPADEAGDLCGPVHHLPTTGWMTVAGGHGQTLRDWLRDWRPDVLHVANPAHVGTAAMTWARELRIPLVVTTMDFWWTCPKGTLLRDDMSMCDGSPEWRACLGCLSRSHPRAVTRLLGRMPAVFMPAVLAVYYAKNWPRGLTLSDMRRWPRRRSHLLRLLGGADHVIFPSHATQAVLGPAVRPGRSSLIPYGLPPMWFRTPRARQPGSVEPDALTIGYAGALLPHKGVHVLLEAICRLGWRQTRVLVAGTSSDTQYQQELQRAASGLNVTFTGPIPAAKMPEFLGGLDLLVLPSLWAENLPFAMLEAHAAGVPVIASRLGGVQEQIGNAQMLFEPGNAADLARALETFRLDPAAARPSRVLTVEETADRTLAVYERVRASAPGRSE